MHDLAVSMQVMIGLWQGVSERVIVALENPGLWFWDQILESLH